MRQPLRRGVAPLNTNPKWPEGYIAVLREAGAQEKTIPFFASQRPPVIAATPIAQIQTCQPASKAIRSIALLTSEKMWFSRRREKVSPPFLRKHLCLGQWAERQTGVCWKRGFGSACAWRTTPTAPSKPISAGFGNS